MLLSLSRNAIRVCSWPGAEHTHIRCSWPALHRNVRGALNTIGRRDYAQKQSIQHKSEGHEARRPDISSPGRISDADGDKEKMYILPMFPYPSGDLHMGHLRVYTISDVLARFRTMQGYNVLHPIGWDAFGLPAENAAIERGVDPSVWTKENIQRMKTQLEAMNGRWHWSSKFATCDPSFYKHTQRLFLLLHEAGLAYQAESLVNYDPVDKTVLANEQVDTNGYSWRSGAKVEKRMLKQWFLRISEFRDALLNDLEQLAKHGMWPERVMAMQENWLGKSKGACVKFPVTALGQDAHADIEVFTTRPDTLYGVQYVALASNHSLVQSLAKTDPELQAFLDTLHVLPPESRVGYLLPKIQAMNPLASEESTPDESKAPLPVYVAPYVLGDYGSGAVMGVPGQDPRDHAFWKGNRDDRPVRLVIAPSPDQSTVVVENEPFVHHGHLTASSGPFAGQTTAQATEGIVQLLQSKGLGASKEIWRLRDWLISRQRYWGTPIPIIHCHDCGPVLVPASQLPVELPPIEEHWQKYQAGNPLEHAHDWVNVPCPKCGSPAKRDTDTMDTFVDSSWYFMRFPDSKNNEQLFSKEVARTFLPVDLYIGGVEHAILHLLYARFISKFLATTPLWPDGAKPEIRGEPFKQVLTQGMVHGKTYSDPSTGKFLKPEEVDLRDHTNPIVVATGDTAQVSYEKMSKSKYNGVDPTSCIVKYGADATRAHMLFQAPVSEVLNWDEDKISGIKRWLNRLHQYVDKVSQRWNREIGDVSLDQTPKNYFHLNKPIRDAVARKDLSLVTPVLESELSNGMLPREKKDILTKMDNHERLWRTVQQTIISVTESYSKTYALNTVVSDLMTLTNTILKVDNDDLRLTRGALAQPSLLRQSTRALIQMMAPVTPAFSQKCWDLIHNIHSSKSKGSIFDFPFPTADGSLEELAPRTQSCAVKINGKLKFALDLPIPDPNLVARDLQKWIAAQIVATEEAKKRLPGVDLLKAHKVYVAKDVKVVNFVVSK